EQAVRGPLRAFPSAGVRVILASDLLAHPVPEAGGRCRSVPGPHGSPVRNDPTFFLPHSPMPGFLIVAPPNPMVPPLLDSPCPAHATSITRVSVTANDDDSDAPISVTFPQAAAVRVDGGDVQVEQIGTEPVVLWVRLDGEPITFTLDEPVSL